MIWINFKTTNFYNGRSGKLSLYLFFTLLCYSSITKADLLSAEKAYQAQDYVTAFTEYKTLAETGLVEAQAKLGSLYFWGLGTAQNYTQAYLWILKAAKNDHSDAQNMMGYFYENGLEITKDIRKAIEWYEKAAKNNHPGAQANLAGIYLLSSEYPRDLERGFQLAKLAADKGNGRAQYLVAHIYLNEYQDHQQALDWYIKSAENGYFEAASLLGKFYFNGEIVEQDRSKAYFWFAIAEAMNDPQAPEHRAKVQGYLDIEDINNLDYQVAQWMQEKRKIPSSQLTPDILLP